MPWAGPIRKPVPRKLVKARRDRLESKVVREVRPQCVIRDGYCRVQGMEFVGRCAGPSEWAHFGEHKRFKTRGKDPRERHTRQGSLMLCDRHHDEYDHGDLDIAALDPVALCDGRLRVTTDEGTCEETECPTLPR